MEKAEASSTGRWPDAETVVPQRCCRLGLPTPNLAALVHWGGVRAGRALAPTVGSLCAGRAGSLRGAAAAGLLEALRLVRLAAITALPRDGILLCSEPALPDSGTRPSGSLGAFLKGSCMSEM